jgi:hypothetical protein
MTGCTITGSTGLAIGAIGWAIAGMLNMNELPGGWPGGTERVTGPDGVIIWN